jgi:hypothetical protein
MAATPSFDEFQRDLWPRIQRAGQRLGQMGRLAFVLSVANTNPSTATEGELLDHRDLIRAFVGTFGGRYELAYDPLPLEVLERIHDRVVFGLKMLSEGRPWETKETGSLVVTPAPELRDKPVKPQDRGYRFPWPVKREYRSPVLSVESLLVLEAAGVIEASQAAIRRCVWCGALFVRTSSQKYCSRRCTQAAINAKRPGRKRRPPFIVQPDPTSDVNATARKARRRTRPSGTKA